MYTPKYSMTLTVLIFTKLLHAKWYHIEISYTEFQIFQNYENQGKRSPIPKLWLSFSNELYQISW
jgi:hypothetical protein